MKKKKNELANVSEPLNSGFRLKPDDEKGRRYDWAKQENEKSIFEHSVDFVEFFVAYRRKIEELLISKIISFQLEKGWIPIDSTGELDIPLDEDYYNILKDSWEVALKDFTMYVNKKNIFSSYNLIEANEYLSALKLFHDQLIFCGEQINKLKSGGNPDPTSAPFLDEKLTPTEKILWKGPMNQLAVLFKWLEEQSLISKSWKKSVDALFLDEYGNPIGKNLSNLASPRAIEKSIPLQKFKSSLEGELTQKLRSNIQG